MPLNLYVAFIAVLIILEIMEKKSHEIAQACFESKMLQAWLGTPWQESTPEAGFFDYIELDKRCYYLTFIKFFFPGFGSVFAVVALDAISCYRALFVASFFGSKAKRKAIQERSLN